MQTAGRSHQATCSSSRRPCHTSVTRRGLPRCAPPYGGMPVSPITVRI